MPNLADSVLRLDANLTDAEERVRDARSICFACGTRFDGRYELQHNEKRYLSSRCFWCVIAGCG